MGRGRTGASSSGRAMVSMTNWPGRAAAAIPGASRVRRRYSLAAGTLPTMGASSSNGRATWAGRGSAGAGERFPGGGAGSSRGRGGGGAGGRGGGGGTGGGWGGEGPGGGAGDPRPPAAGERPPAAARRRLVVPPTSGG